MILVLNGPRWSLSHTITSSSTSPSGGPPLAPSTQVSAPPEVGTAMLLIILLKKGIHIKVPECVHHLHPWISQLKDRHIQSCRHQPLLLPTPSVAPASMLVACSLTRSGVPIRVWCPSVHGGGRQTPSAHHSALGLR